MQTQQTQRNSRVCGSGVQKRAQSIVCAPTAPLKQTKTRSTSRNTGGHISVMALPRLPFVVDVSLFKIVFATSVFAICMYLYMVVSTVVATVERKSLEERVREESTDLAYRETEYSKLIGSITLASARASGYIDAEGSGFATRADAPTLTLNNE